MANVIRVSFKDNDFEIKLLNDIREECVLMGDSAWMKIAAYEKIQRDRNKSTNNMPIQKSNTNVPIINSFEDLLK